MGGSEKTQSDNFCNVCGRPTNKRKILGAAWDNQFFVCNNCQKVWCADCMGGISGKGAKKVFSLAKKKSVECVECNNRVVMLRLPKNLPFKQIRISSSSLPPQKDVKSLNASAQTNKKKKSNLCLFISYATNDFDVFKIGEIAKNLKNYKEINEVLYWQKDAQKNIIEYMEKNIEKCDLVLLFCTPNASKSKAVQKEYNAAQSLEKSILPIFIDIDHVPPLLKAEIGLKYDLFDFQKNIVDLYELILKKI